LEFYENRDSLYKREAELVNEQTLADPMNMNLKLGGEGGWDYVSNHRSHNDSVKAGIIGHQNLVKMILSDSEYRARYSKIMSDAQKRSLLNGNHISGFSLKQKELVERSRNPKSITKRKETFARIDHQHGEKNSQFGTCWIHSIELQECKKIKKDDLETFLEQGWIKGRKMKF
jgi:hypothetical protein